MALPLSLLFVLQPIIAHILAREGDPARVLSLGYPDLLADADQLAALFDDGVRAGLALRDDGDAIARWHGVGDRVGPLVETRSFFAALGLELDCVDINPSRGFERPLDLNDPLPADMAGRYDLVLDLGTIEHCFNVARAVANVAEAVAPGGFAMHVNPLSMFNHGFYNLNPTFYVDFYGQNGFSVLFMSGIAGPPSDHRFFDIDAVKRLREVPEGASNIMVVQRNEARPIVWPTQAKYRLNPELKA